MKKFARFHAVLLTLILLFANFPTTFAQETKTALFRGYRTGYSDGYMAGYRDSTENSKRSVEKHQDFVKANRAYLKDYGSLEDYRDGYQQGFTSGYDTGFEHRAFDSSVPSALERRGVKTSPPKEKPAEPRMTQTSAKSEAPQQRYPEPVLTSSIPNSQPLIIIPANTELIVEMQNNIDTNESRRGDAFQAKIVAPAEIEGAIIEGRVSELSKPGRIKRRAELQLSFDRIILDQSRWSNMNAMVVEALPPDNPKQKNNVKKVDPEGTVQGKSSLKSDAIIVGSAAGTGATVGAIAGGPVGFAVGAAVGGAFGLGGVLVARGKDIKLNEGQRLRIRTAYETQIR